MRLIILLLLSSLSLHLYSQDINIYNPFKTKVNSFELGKTISLREEPETSNWKDRIGFGGAVMASFGNFTFVLLNPQIIYRINERTWVGAGPYYQYVSQNFGGTRISSSIYGATAFGRKFITEELFLQAEYNYLNYEFGLGRATTGFGMVGAGYQPTPNFSLTVMYIVTNDPNGLVPFGGSPWVIRGGIFL